MRKCKNCGNEVTHSNTLMPYCNQFCYSEKNAKKSKPICARDGCTNEFNPLLSTQKHCSSYCYHKDNKNALKRKKAKINPKSKKQAEWDKKYSYLRKAFLLEPRNQRCPVYPNLRATTVHHKMGRGINTYADDWAEKHNIPLLIDTRFWLAASMEGHEWIERNPIKSKELGYSINRL